MGLIALNHESEVVWDRVFPIPQTQFGTGTSPVLHGDALYLVRDVSGTSWYGAIEGDSAVYCFAADAGEERWMTPRRDAGVNFSSPYMWRHEGGTELVVGGTGTLRGYDANSGRENWVVNNLPIVVCPSPIGSGNVLVFGGWTTDNVPGPEKVATIFDVDVQLPQDVQSDPVRFVSHFDKDGDDGVSASELPEGRIQDAFRLVDADGDGKWEVGELRPAMTAEARPGRNVMLAVRAGGRGDVTKSHVLWEHKKALPYVASPMIYDDRVYFVKKGGFVSCLDLQTGEVHYQKRLGLGGEYYATPILVGDRVIIAAERGAIFVLAQGEKFELISRNDFREGIYATPAVVDNTLYLRTANHLWAFGEPQ